MAYYTNQNTATNVVTAGNIRAELQEWADLENEIPYTDPEDYIAPGDNLSKAVTVKNTGLGDAWIRIQFVIRAEGDNIPAQGTPPVVLDVNTEAWTEQDGWYYYNAALKSGETTEPIFTTVSFEKTMDNNWKNALVYIDVAMQATQVANNGASALDAAEASWPGPTPTPEP